MNTNENYKDYRNGNGAKKRRAVSAGGGQIHMPWFS